MSELKQSTPDGASTSFGKGIDVTGNIENALLAEEDITAEHLKKLNISSRSASHNSVPALCDLLKLLQEDLRLIQASLRARDLNLNIISQISLEGTPYVVIVLPGQVIRYEDGEFFVAPKEIFCAST